MVFLVNFGDAVRDEEALPAGKIIDMHCHIAGIGAGGSGCFISDSLRTSWKFRVYLKSFGVTLQDLEEHGDALIIQKIVEPIKQSRYLSGAVILAMDGVAGRDGRLDRGKTEIYVPNEFVAVETGKYDFLYYAASINPYRFDALERIRKASADGAVLIKWLPSVMHIDPSDRTLIPFYQEMLRLDLPLLCHTGNEHSFTWARNELGDPRRLELPLSVGVTVIAAHLAATGKNQGQDNMARLMEMFPRYPKLYGDISSLTQVNKLGCLQRALGKKEILDRLLYGTDYPLIQTALCHPIFHALKMSPARLSRIMGISNPWDRDIMLKLALGVPSHVFTRPAEILGLP
jgi:uncharacterized protein